jgi:hypothetical protein
MQVSAYLGLPSMVCHLHLTKNFDDYIVDFFCSRSRFRGLSELLIITFASVHPLIKLEHING